VNANAITTFQGNHLGGTVSSVWNADGSTYNVGSSLVNGLGSVATVKAEYSVSGVNPLALGMKLKVSSSIATTGFVWLHNWNTGQFDLQQTNVIAAGSFTNLYLNSVTPDSPYIDPTGRVEAAFRCLAPERNGNAPPFTLRVDLMGLLR
jgi:hypothetical protein